VQGIFRLAGWARAFKHSSEDPTMANPVPSIESWVQFLSEKEIPVMRQTVRAMADARARLSEINGREISALVLRDPLMTLRVLRFTLGHRGKRQLQEITTVEHAVMMLGVEPFFHHFAQFDVIEDQLKPQPQALLGLLHVIRRAQRACRYAADWAIWRRDLNSEDIAVAATLHDLADLLIWCFAPQQALQIQAMKKANPTLRSAEAQIAVLGFPLIDLQLALCTRWQMPELLQSLINDAHAERVRVRNVKLAVDLARHSANGWDDPALPDDFSAIELLMNIDHDTLMLRLGLQTPDEDEAALTRPSPDK
jgi:HD-like signal output (HDOD) protein